MKKNALQSLLTSLLDIQKFLLNAQANRLGQFFGDPLEGIKILHSVHMGFSRMICNGFQLRPHGIFHPDGKDLHITAPQPCGWIFKGIRRLAICNEDSDTGHVRASSSVGNKDLLPHIGHGFASVSGSSSVWKASHRFNHCIQIVVCVQIKLSVWIPAVLHKADLDLVGTDVKGGDQVLQKSSHFCKVSQPYTV